MSTNKRKSVTFVDRTTESSNDTFGQNSAHQQLGSFVAKDNSDEIFSAHSSNDGVDPMDLALTENTGNLSFALPMKQFTKLEVVSAKQIENILRFHHVVVSFGLLYTVVLVILANTAFKKTFFIDHGLGSKEELTFYILPNWLLWVIHVTKIPIFVYIVCLCVIFSTRIFALKHHARTKEQYWVVFLLLSMVLYLQPLFALTKINDFLIYKFDISKKWSIHKWFRGLNPIISSLSTGAFTAATIFYVWANIHSYRVLESGLTVMFYVPKVITMLLYAGAKIAVVFIYKIRPSDVMFATFFGMISLYRSARIWYAPGVVFCSLLFVFEIGLAIGLYFEYSKTKRKLKNSDYLKYRSKQIGFRFFVYHNLTFHSVFMFTYFVFLLGLPNGINALQLSLGTAENHGFNPHDVSFGIQLLLVAYCTVEAYVNLPSDAIGFRGWFQPQLQKDEKWNAGEFEPLTYRNREPPSLHGTVSDLKRNCFVMQTHVNLFNFAWLVYYWNTPKADNFKISQDVFKFVIQEYIKDEETDTHVLVIDGEDRIVIVFKGTTSTKNLKTDVNMFYSNLRTLLPTQIGETDPEGDEHAAANALFQTRRWRKAKIHKGFAAAYRAVASQLLMNVKKLQDQKRRVVFITGHSLGGALATICSLDLFLRLGLTRDEIFVSTFGAPRVGNKAFWNIYDDNIPTHWRIVIGPDVVAKLPKVGYYHVGRKVLLTVDGDLFIDPNSLELNMWSTDVASILYHRKASYLLAMRAWCERHHGNEYLPEFWPFPISKDDTRRFQHAMVRSPTTQYMNQKPVMNKRVRIMMLNSMVNALDDGGHYEPRIVDKWYRLAMGITELRTLGKA